MSYEYHDLTREIADELGRNARKLKNLRTRFKNGRMTKERYFETITAMMEELCDYYKREMADYREYHKDYD